MKKAFRSFLLLWALGLVIFNVLVFGIPVPEGLDRFGGGFWAGYVGITLSLLCQLVCAGKFFSSENADKAFLNIPLLRISRTGLVFTVILGVASIIIIDFPNWLGAALCLLVAVLEAVALIKANAAAEAVEEIGQRVRDRSAFLRELTTRAESLRAGVSDPRIAGACAKVCDALRFADPVTRGDLSAEDEGLTKQFEALETFVTAGAADAAEAAADELVRLIRQRNAINRAAKK